MSDELERLRAQVEWLRSGCDEALAELKLWRMLVEEGSVPRYTVVPGAALNQIVTSTDKLIRRMEWAKNARAAAS